MIAEILQPVVGYFPFFPGTSCFLVGGLWIIWLVLAIWVYKDAEKRGKNAILWLLLVFFLGIIGLILYLITRDKKEDLFDSLGGSSQTSNRRCPSCGRNIPEDAKVCPYCGNKFQQY